MGTGIVSILLVTIPYQARWLYWLSVVFFITNTILFSLAFTVSFLRYTLYPEIWGAMIKDATNSLFLGTVPIGFATLVESWIFLCVPYWGSWAKTFAWVMWMIDSVVAAAVTLSLGILMYVSPVPGESLLLNHAYLSPASRATIKPPLTGSRPRSCCQSLPQSLLQAQAPRLPKSSQIQNTLSAR